MIQDFRVLVGRIHPRRDRHEEQSHGVLTDCGIRPRIVAKESDHGKRLHNASVALRKVTNTPDQAIPQHILDKPDHIFVRAGCGKEYLLRLKKSNFGWTDQLTVYVTGGSIGLQLGGSKSDDFLLVKNENDADRLLSSQFKLGGVAKVAAGPMTRTAQILSPSRSSGVFT